MRLVFSGWKSNPRAVDLVHLLRRKLGMSLAQAKEAVDLITAFPVESFDVQSESAAKALAAGGKAEGVWIEARGKRAYLTGFRLSVDMGLLIRLLCDVGGMASDEAVQFVERIMSRDEPSLVISEQVQGHQLCSEIEELGFVCTLVETP